MIAIIASASGLFLILCVLCCAYRWWGDLAKVFAPGVAKKKEATIDEFIVQENTPMEDLDPEMTINPVMAAKMEMENNQGGRGGRRRAPVGAPGALGKLGITLSPVEKKPVPKGEKYLKNVDKMLEKSTPVGSVGTAASPEPSRVAPQKNGIKGLLVRP